MSIARAISHLLAAVVNKPADFKRRWNQPAPAPSAANVLQGRWEGEWISETNGHRGALRCLLSKKGSESDNYEATFHAVYCWALRVCYTVSLRGEFRDGQLVLEGEADIGRLAGGLYKYLGKVSEHEFRCTYRCKYDRGTFYLKPA